MSEKGDAIGRFELALSYLDGADKSVARAIEWMGKALDVADECESDEIKNMFSLSQGKAQEFDMAFRERLGRKSSLDDMLKEADEVKDSDKIKAYSCYKMAAELNSSIAQYWVGQYCVNGWGACKIDYKAAADWYRKSAEQGLPEAMKAFGDCYSRGVGVHKDKTEAANWYRKSAEKDSLDGMLALAESLSDERSKKEEAFWLRKAAESGSARAMYRLSIKYKNGSGVEEDMSEWEKWWKRAFNTYLKAGENGVPEAMKECGDYYRGMYSSCLREDEWLERDEGKAIYWYEKAAERGLVDAMDALDSVYLHKESKFYSKEKSKFWFLKRREAFEDLANKGFPHAMEKLGESYYFGWNTGVKISEDSWGTTPVYELVDVVKAIDWYRKSAEQGYPRAMLFLGECYSPKHYRECPEKNVEEALKWLKMAVEQGDDSVKKSAQDEIIEIQK